MFISFMNTACRDLTFFTSLSEAVQLSQETQEFPCGGFRTSVVLYILVTVPVQAKTVSSVVSVYCFLHSKL